MLKWGGHFFDAPPVTIVVKSTEGGQTFKGHPMDKQITIFIEFLVELA